MPVTEKMSAVALLTRRARRRSGSEARLRLALQRSTDAIIAIDPGHDLIVEANTKACRLLGYPRGEIVTCELRAILPLDMAALREFMRSVITQGCGWTDELSCTSKDGEVIPTEISASALKVHEKTHVVAIVRSILERKAREEFLQRSVRMLEELQFRISELSAAKLRLEEEVSQRRLVEQKLRNLLHSHRLILDSVGEGILRTDVNGKATFVSSDAAALLGRTPEHVADVDVRSLFKQPDAEPNDREQGINPLEDALKNGNVRRDEETVTSRRDGRQQRFDLPHRRSDLSSEFDAFPAGSKQTESTQTDSNQAIADQATFRELEPVEHELQRRERDKRNIENALRHTRVKIAGAGGAAELLGVKPSTLRSRIKVYGISP